LKIGVTCYPTVGGSGILGTRLGVEFAKRGHKTHFITLERPFALQGVDYDFVKVHRVSVVEYPLFKYPPYTVALATEMADITDKENLDLLHVHYSLPHSTAAQLAREVTGKPYITTLHGSDVTILGQDPAYERINTMSVEASDAITAVSKYMADEAHKLGIDKEIHEIPNFVDHKKYQPAPCELIEAREEEAITLIHVSNFRPVKRVEDIVYSMCVLTKKVPAARLILVGDGPDRRRVERLVDKLGLKENIRMMGYRNDIPDILRCADALVMASETESAPLTILEAMSTGLPIIATDVGGIPEQVHDGVNGFLVPVKRPDDIAEAALKINADINLQIKMGENSRKTVLEKYTVDRVLDQYMKVYEAVL
jgi:N-acetyl-alpha-D-glucosaminyl L-malate synthase BshA